VRELGFDGVDINMGCPDKSIEKQGCGSAMIKNPLLAKAIIKAAKEGAGDIPVSVKTRLGYNKDELEEWLPALLSAEPAVVTIHARTRKEMSKVPARWERVKRAVEIRNELKSETLIFGNGDVSNLEEARDKVRQTGCDGVMIGRGIFGNPWLFSSKKEGSSFNYPSVKERLEVLLEHTKLYEEKLGGIKNFSIMKKHFKSYVQSFDHSKELRTKLMETNNAGEVEEIIKNYLA
jgi:tRNA-dihydrouridine synthase